MKNSLPLLLLVLLFTAFKPVMASQITVTGTITDETSGLPLQGVTVWYMPDKINASSDQNGKYTIKVPANATELLFVNIAYDDVKVRIKGKVINVKMKISEKYKNVVIRGPQLKKEIGASGLRGSVYIRRLEAASTYVVKGKEIQDVPITNMEQYATLNENPFRTALTQPLSTFSIDVDVASYSNLRRFINNGNLPPADAVRIEEMINYFDYGYKQPKGNDPINIQTEISNTPWNAKHKLVKIGLQGKKTPSGDLPASNLVFLIDVSGSMETYNKLPLLVSSFKLLTDQLRSSDKVAIVVYAGNAGLVLPSTPGDQKIKIKEALNQLTAGGSTAGGQGIELAYKVAADNFIKEGNNRVILATDGDFNVGVSSDAGMQKLIEFKRKSGIFLTVLGFGMGNYKDNKMELLADKGNGNYAYIDNISEARKVLINEFGGTMFTIAKDVKLQVEFNPAKVQAYRLIGYENRLLKARDFNDDSKDAGEMGAGHTVTALYEVIPVGVKSNFSGTVDDLKYQADNKPAALRNSKEMLTVKLRYKLPEENISKLIEHPVADKAVPFEKTSDNFRFSAAVAEFGMHLRQSDYCQNSNFDHLINIAQHAIGKDFEGYRAEFLKLARSAKLLAKGLLTVEQTNKIDEKN